MTIGLQCWSVWSVWSVCPSAVVSMGGVGAEETPPPHILPLDGPQGPACVSGRRSVWCSFPSGLLFKLPGGGVQADIRTPRVVGGEGSTKTKIINIPLPQGRVFFHQLTVLVSWEWGGGGILVKIRPRN